MSRQTFCNENTNKTPNHRTKWLKPFLKKKNIPEHKIIQNSTKNKKSQHLLNSPCRWGKTGYLNIVAMASIWVWLSRKKIHNWKLVVLYLKKISESRVFLLCPACTAVCIKAKPVRIQRLFYSCARTHTHTHTHSVARPSSTPTQLCSIYSFKRKLKYFVFVRKLFSFPNHFWMPLFQEFSVGWECFLKIQNNNNGIPPEGPCSWGNAPLEVAVPAQAVGARVMLHKAAWDKHGVWLVDFKRIRST